MSTKRPLVETPYSFLATRPRLRLSRTRTLSSACRTRINVFYERHLF